MTKEFNENLKPRGIKTPCRTKHNWIRPVMDYVMPVLKKGLNSTHKRQGASMLTRQRVVCADAEVLSHHPEEDSS